jgi:putative hydrolase of the HAD superfamily
MQEDRSAQDAKIRVKAVVFDYGNVLCHPQQPSDVESMAGICGMTVPRFRQLYWKFRIRYDRGDLSGDSYWDAVAREEGKVLSREQIAELFALDGKSWSRRNETTLEWVKQLHRAGVRLGLLSNMPLEISRYLMANYDWLAWFHSLTFSCDVGRVKPDPAIYEICLKELKLVPEEVLFLDDIAANVHAASALGIHSLIFDTIEQTTARVGERFDLPIPGFSKGSL